jgi:hypothetical protein
MYIYMHSYMAYLEKIIPSSSIPYDKGEEKI